MSKPASTWAYFSIGRHPAVAALLLAMAVAVCLSWWYVNIPTRFLGQFHSRWVSMLELVPILAGTLALVAVAPIVPRWDLFTTGPRRWLSTITAAATIALSTALPTITILVLSQVPRTWIPGHDDYLPSSQPFLKAIDPTIVAGTSCVVLTILAIAAGAITLMGKYVGLAITLATYLGLILIQSTSAGRFIPLQGWPLSDTPITPATVVTSVALTTIALVIWHRKVAQTSTRPE